MTDQTQTTLRDTLEQSFTEHVKEPTAPMAEEVKTEVEATEVKAETEEQKAQRIRDEKGRFASGKTEEKPAEIKEVKPRPQRPSSWKKEMWDHWEKLDPVVAEYLNQREQEFSKGVSTYKKEWDNAKPILDAMAQFQPLLQQHNINPTQWITNLGNAHRMLAMGSPEQKLQMFKRLASDYGIPMEGISSQEKPDFLQYMNPISEKISQLEGKLHSYTSRVEQEQQAMIQRDIDLAANEVDAQGNLMRPHFEEVRETMAGLLQSGLADNLKDAYDTAIHLPRHKSIYESLQQQQAQLDATRKAEEERQRVSKAKAQAVSTRSTTPGAASPVESKGLRADLDAAFDAVTAGRV